MSAWVNPDNPTAAASGGTGIFDLLDSAINKGGDYLIASKTGAVPAGYSQQSNTGATPTAVVNQNTPSSAPTMFGANAMFKGVDMRMVALGFGALLIIGLILRK